MNKAAEENVRVEATAIDISKVACAITKDVMGDRARVSKGNIAKMTRFLEELDPIERGSQDMVLLNYVLQYTPIEEVLIEANRVLKPGGRLLITNFKPKNTMRWNEFWTNVRAAWEAGRQRTFGHGRLYELARYFVLFFRHAIGIIKFARSIDRDVRLGIIPENPASDELNQLLEQYGFRLISEQETHHQAAYQLYAEKVSETES
jgi:ubiquinone/menaquinone biosynthesis C-methylase UbiE